MRPDPQCTPIQRATSPGLTVHAPTRTTHQPRGRCCVEEVKNETTSRLSRVNDSETIEAFALASPLDQNDGCILRVCTPFTRICVWIGKALRYNPAR